MDCEGKQAWRCRCILGRDFGFEDAWHEDWGSPWVGRRGNVAGAYDGVVETEVNGVLTSLCRHGWCLWQGRDLNS